jgi:hypothetical protein
MKYIQELVDDKSQAVFRFEGKWDFLSNFYIDPFDGYCAEMDYQSRKAMNDDDRDRILTQFDPREAKKIGNKIRCRPDWESIKIGEMEKVIDRKFSSLVMQKLLLTTLDRVLIEGNWWHDVFWGICTGSGRSKKCRGKHEPFGDNYLGKLLMARRSVLAQIPDRVWLLK